MLWMRRAPCTIPLLTEPADSEREVRGNRPKLTRALTRVHERRGLLTPRWSPPREDLHSPDSARHREPEAAMDFPGPAHVQFKVPGCALPWGRRTAARNDCPGSAGSSRPAPEQRERKHLALRGRDATHRLDQSTMESPWPTGQSHPPSLAVPNLPLRAICPELPASRSQGPPWRRARP